jgi:hypothetical protein
MDHNPERAVMTDAEQDPVVERFRPTNGRFSGIVGLVGAAVVLVLAIVAWDPGLPLGIAIVACLAALVVWVALLRPAMWATGRELVMRNMLHTDHLPLAAIDRVGVGQVVAVSVAGKRFVSPTVGHSTRATARNRRTGTKPTATESYPVFVEERLAHLAKEDRDRRGVAKGSPEQEALAAERRRTFAWPEIVGLVVLALAFVVWLLAH